LDLLHKPNLYRLYIDSAFITPLELPYLFVHTDPVVFLEKVKLYSPKFYTLSINWTSALINPKKIHKWGASIKAQEWCLKFLDIPLLTKYCHDSGRSF